MNERLFGSMRFGYVGEGIIEMVAVVMSLFVSPSSDFSVFVRKWRRKGKKEKARPKLTLPVDKTESWVLVNR